MCSACAGDYENPDMTAPTDQTNPVLLGMHSYLERHGLLRPEREWRTEDYQTIAEDCSGQIHHTGGGILVVLIEQRNGDVLAVNDEMIALYKKTANDRTAEDVFWNNEPAEEVPLT